MKYLFVAMMVGLSVSAFLWVLLLSQNRDLKLRNQRQMEQFENLSMRYVNLDWQMKQFRSQLGQSEHQKSLLVAEVAQLKSQLVPPAQFEFQKWSSPYPEPQVATQVFVSPQDSSLVMMAQSSAQCRCNSQGMNQQGCC